jgi:hypothetical protein
MTISQVSRLLFERYLIILNDKFVNDLLSIRQEEAIIELKGICDTAISSISEYDNSQEDNKMTEDKISRWLGYLQGIMVYNGWISVLEERNFSRPLFHKAYEEQGINKPKSVKAKMKNIVFHIVDMNKFNAMCCKKYDILTYKELSKDKLLVIGFEIMKIQNLEMYKTLQKLYYTFCFNTEEKENMYSFIFVNPRAKTKENS